LTVAAADKHTLCPLNGRVEENYRLFNGGILAPISLARRISSESVVVTGSATCRAAVRSVTNRRSTRSGCFWSKADRRARISHL